MILKLCSTWKTQATDPGKFLESLGTEKADMIQRLYNAHLGNEVNVVKVANMTRYPFSRSFDCTVMAYSS